MNKEEAEIKWQEYLEYIDRCEKKRWIPAKPNQEMLDALEQKTEENQEAQRKKLIRRKKV
jgi:hypothetical protein